MKNIPLFRIFALAGLLLFPGCAGYQLGSMLPDDIKTVYVPTFVNETDQPLVDIEATRAFIEAIQLDGSLTVVEDKSVADSVVYVTVQKYTLTPLSFNRDRETQAEEFRALLTAKILFERTRSGEVIFEHPAIQGDGTFELAGDMTTSKRLALPDVSRDLAHDLVEAMVEAW